MAQATAQMKVEVIRSHRRSKTVEARMVGDTLQITIPARLTEREEAEWVGEMMRRIQHRRERGKPRSSADLVQRAAQLASRYGLPAPASIRWVGNQNTRWGSCTPGDASIRISTKLAREPSWVLDYVIMHELAHLVVAGHSPDFWCLVERYPRSERARGFLLARSWAPGSGTEPAVDDDAVIDIESQMEPHLDGADVPAF